MSPLLLIVAFVLAAVFNVAVQREYEIWAPALARAFLRLASLLCRYRRGPWWADLLYVQRVEKRSGLPEATWCLLAAPGLALQDWVSTVRPKMGLGGRWTVILRLIIGAICGLLVVDLAWMWSGHANMPIDIVLTVLGILSALTTSIPFMLRGRVWWMEALFEALSRASQKDLDV